MCPSDPAHDEAYLQGDAVRREVLGDAHVDRTNTSASELTTIWRRFATEVAWGRFWTRPGIDLRTKSMCTVAALVALGDKRELRTHIRGALRVGISPEELGDIFIQVACYAGMPRGGNAFETLQEILAESQDS